MKYLYLDVESTGLSITKDRIIQIGCIKDGIPKKVLINPTIPIPKEATAIHRITDEMVKDAPTFKEYSVSLLKYLQGNDIAGYNSDNFDIPLLMEEFARAGLEWDLSNIKTTDVYLNEIKINRRDLASVYKRMTGKTLDDAHDALSDARATMEIHEAQMKLPDIEEILNDEDEIQYMDFTRKIYLNEQGVPTWSFGKNKDKDIRKDRNYINWVLRSDFTKQVKDIIREWVK